MEPVRSARVLEIGLVVLDRSLRLDELDAILEQGGELDRLGSSVVHVERRYLRVRSAPEPSTRQTPPRTTPQTPAAPR